MTINVIIVSITSSDLKLEVTGLGLIESLSNHFMATIQCYSLGKGQSLNRIVVEECLMFCFAHFVVTQPIDAAIFQSSCQTYG